MPLSAGQRIGAYEVISPLGAGGMGEVYRARDSKLKREVAIKVLPADVANDRERLARFQREAEVLASLNHPHIAHVYGIEDPSAGSGQAALVMELVDGEDLSQRIARGAIPLEEALPIAKQIAEALEAAHDAGVVHRDLKPANIKVRDDGTVKVLDFGLAKGSAIGDQGSGNLANSPTLTSPVETMRGVILGTAAYMAPEQAKGKFVDKRADIWAFGCVLYEMLTGMRAFKGDDVTDIITSVLRDTPDWNALPVATPVLIKRLLRHCLNRDPRGRIADMRDVRIEVDDSITEPSTGVAPPGVNNRLPWIVAAVSLAMVASMAAAFAAGWIGTATTSDQPEIVRFSLPPLDGRRGFFRPAVSPNGRYVAYIATNDSGFQSLWVHWLGTGIAKELSGTDRITPGGSAFWSPDSRTVAFFADGKLKRVDLDGGAPVVVCDAVEGRGGTWNQHGDIVFSQFTGPLMRVAASGGSPAIISELKGPTTTHRTPHFLSDGEHFVFMAAGTDLPLLLGSLRDRTTRALGNVDALAGVALPDLVLFVSDGQLFAQRVEIASGALVNTRQAIVGDVGAAGGSGWASASNDVLVYRTNPAGGKVVLAWVDRRGTVSPISLAPGTYGNPSLSPNGRHIALSIRDQTGEHIWVYDNERGTLSKRTFESTNSYPIWSPDGSLLTYSAGVAQAGPLMQVAADGSGPSTVLVSNEQLPGQKIAISWSADGTLAFQSGQDVMVRDRDGKLHQTLKTPAFEREARFSSSGRWLAYRSNETGRDEVYVQSYPPGSGKWQISTQGGAQPMWGADGKELFYKNGNALMVVPVAFEPAFRPGAPQLLFRLILPESTPGDPSRYGVMRDSQRFLVTTSERVESTESPVNVILNWRGVLRRP